MIDPDLTDRGNAKGRYSEFSMRLADSKIFPGNDSTLDSSKPVRQERKVFVYIPAAYQDGTKAPILVTLDGPGRLNLVRNALDNLTISTDPSRKLPPFIAIGVENGGNDGKGSERGLEYDTLSDRFARFINDEVLPAVLSNAEIKAAYPNIALTTNPWGKGVMGCSSGGAAALTFGVRLDAVRPRPSFLAAARARDLRRAERRNRAGGACILATERRRRVRPRRRRSAARGARPRRGAPRGLRVRALRVSGARHRVVVVSRE